MGVHTSITWPSGDDVVSVDTTPPGRTDRVVSMRLGTYFQGRNEGSIGLSGDPEALLDAAVQIAQIAVAHYDGSQPGASACRADDLASLIGLLLASVNRDDLEPALAANIARNLSVARDDWARQATLPPSARLGSVADAVALDAEAPQ